MVAETMPPTSERPLIGTVMVVCVVPHNLFPNLPPYPTDTTWIAEGFSRFSKFFSLSLSLSLTLESTPLSLFDVAGL